MSCAGLGSNPSSESEKSTSDSVTINQLGESVGDINETDLCFVTRWLVSGRISGHFRSSGIAPMKRAGVRFYAQLNDFLPPEKRTQIITCTFDVSGSVKDMIESLGVPHTEVDLILVNGEAVDFGYRVQEGDRISVYPEFRVHRHFTARAFAPTAPARGTVCRRHAPGTAGSLPSNAWLRHFVPERLCR